MTTPSRHSGHLSRFLHGVRLPRGVPERSVPRGPGELSDAAEAAVRGYLACRPEATVVVLGEGLGTGFRRLDNGRLTWLSVLPPADAAARRMLLPDTPRRHTAARPGTGAGWPDAVRAAGAAERGVVVAVPGTPAGLPARAVGELVAVCAARFPGGALVLDALPRWTATALRAARLHPAVAAVRIRRPAARTAVGEVRFAARGGA